jgi:dTDP-4-amino-4,6-dideoxygalactose transaminase
MNDFPIRFNDPAFDYHVLHQEIDAAVQQELARGDYIRGAAVGRFEAAFAEKMGARCAVGVASGTDALHLALRAAGIGPGDEVITAPNTFTATAMAIVHAGARPVLADVDETLTLDPARLAVAIGPRTRAVIPVHLYGLPAAMDEILALTRPRGLVVIEDACQAHGARDRGRAAGTLGNAGAFSFYPTKNLGAVGDGGMVLTDDEALAQAIRALASYGGPHRDEHERVGFNSRLDSLQAAVLSVKLGWLAVWNQARARNAEIYRKILASAPGLRLPPQPAGRESVYHQFVIRVPAPMRDPLRQRLLKQGVPTMIHYPTPIHLQPAFAGLGYSAGSFPVAEAAAAEIISLPIAQHLTWSQIEDVAKTVLGEFNRLSC